MPEVVVIDEIGTNKEALAARTISQRGVQLIATAHGHELDNILKNPSMVDLLGGVQTWVNSSSYWTLHLQVTCLLLSLIPRGEWPAQLSLYSKASKTSLVLSDFSIDHAIRTARDVFSATHNFYKSRAVHASIWSVWMQGGHRWWGNETEISEGKDNQRASSST